VSAAVAEEPTATAVTLQHTLGLLLAAAGMTGLRMPVTHELEGAREITAPKVV
jgi:hypothetical protein